MTTEPQPGTSLETRGETLPDVAVPNRAGAIVSEFVSSIVEEAQVRATEIMAEAERDREALVLEAHEGAARIGARVTAIADELSSLVTDLRRTSESLQADPAIRAAMALPVPDGTEGTDLVPSAGAGAPIMDAVVVEDADADAAPAEPEGVAYIGADEAAARLQAMSDEELAEAYSTATREVSRHAGAPDDAGRYMNLIEAIVHEALTRPAFTDDEPPRKRFRRAGGRRRRRRAVILAELRNACREASEPAEAREPVEAPQA